jgi:hypothetical protein
LISDTGMASIPSNDPRATAFLAICGPPFIRQ